ncbi:hypothetical protein V6N12_031461 [Hibiscus sabdariffa]|uniref:Uncharacterized protein n=1 Tax=Hibiscus sabdariffa TaxID=183260 RepID=A0ABR2CPA7_9ROSI
MLPSGHWNFPLLAAIFPTSMVPHFSNIRCPQPGDIADFCCWRWDRQFSVGSAYGMLMANRWNPPHPYWMKVWKLAVPQRLRLFLWLALNQKLMTNAERSRRGISPSPCCHLCGVMIESVIHVLRDCSPARAIWDSILSPAQTSNFFSSGVAKWLLDNISVASFSLSGTLPWNLLFSSCVWQIWKSRNDRVFASLNHDPSITLSRCISWAMSYNNLYHSARASDVSLQSSCQFLQWQSPPVGWVCLHVDGAINTGTGLGLIGGLFRNSVGSWISGYGRSIGFSDALTSELWAIHDGLVLAWNNGFRKLQVRSDCTMAISLITNSDAASSSHALVRAIVGFRRRSWSLDFIWVPHEINRPADSLARQVPSDHFDTLLFDQPPCCIHGLLSRDVHGPPYCKDRIS